jgi:hypothetical protein
MATTAPIVVTASEPVSTYNPPIPARPALTSSRRPRPGSLVLLLVTVLPLYRCTSALQAMVTGGGRAGTDLLFPGRFFRCRSLSPQISPLSGIVDLRRVAEAP